MPLVEEVSDDGGVAASSSSIAPILRELSARLALPEELLASFMSDEIPQEAMEIYHDHASRTLSQIEERISGSGWDMLDPEDQGIIMGDVTRLYGHDPFTSSDIRSAINRISTHIDTQAIALYLLQHPLRNLFSTPHPSINPQTSRALSRPAGGPDAKVDFHDSSNQPFKLASGWGCYNMLAWCIAQLPDDALESKIGLILPPTLTLMDDWDPAWRGRGCTVLASWIDRFPTEILKRMGLDRPLLDSAIHTLSLHANPPLPQVLPLALRLIDKTLSCDEKADRLSEIMDKGVISGWTYAPPGADGRRILVNIDHMVETLCDELGTGIVRWLKTIIPALLGPLQFTPSPAAADHFSANLSALLCVLRTARPTGRIARWRGQILHVCGILAVSLRDRGLDDDESFKAGLQDHLKHVFAELQSQCPSVQQDEYPAMVKLDPAVFQPLVPIPA